MSDDGLETSASTNDEAADAAPARRSRRGGGRDARRSARSRADTNAAAFLTRSLAPFEIVSDEGLEMLEYNADTILETVGVNFVDFFRNSLFRESFFNSGSSPV